MALAKGFERVVGALVRRKANLTVVESCCGGLINASIIAVPGCSAVYHGGSVVYSTAKARHLLPSDAVYKSLSAPTSEVPGETEADRYVRGKREWAAKAATAFCEAQGTDYALAESGASGPTFRPAGLVAGFTALAVAQRCKVSGDVKVVAEEVVKSDGADREANMRLFTKRAGRLLATTHKAALGEELGPDEDRRASLPPAIDRMSHLREDAQEVAVLRSSSAARFVVVQQRKILIEPPGDLAKLTRGDAEKRFGPIDDARTTFLGVDDQGKAVFTVEAVAAAAGLVDARVHAPLLATQAARDVSLYATALAAWQARSAFCSACGTAAPLTHSGHARTCGQCKSVVFPRQDPAVIMLVASRCGGYALLARSPRHPPKVHTTLAGFVEAGESFEAAVRREVLEETGVIVDDVAYRASQPWPFPQSTMIGFAATADMTQPLVIDANELVSAEWFSKAQVRDAVAVSHSMDAAFAAETLEKHPTLALLVPPRGVIARDLIEDWLRA